MILNSERTALEDRRPADRSLHAQVKTNGRDFRGTLISSLLAGTLVAYISLWPLMLTELVVTCQKASNPSNKPCYPCASFLPASDAQAECIYAGIADSCCSQV